MYHWLLVETAVVWLIAGATAQENGSSPKDKVIVRLQQGLIQGTRKDTDRGSYYEFGSIPYVKAPVGELRLQAPQPGEPWEGVRNGSTDHPLCPQLIISFTVGQEDCLYLNVFTPRPYKSNLPVMVWIHGGGFHTGTAMNRESPGIISNDVVLVNFQYRLSTLGFLSAGDSVLPGNLGLKDQVMALRWVKDNIRDLGGDPEKITLFGYSSGATSIHFHMMSPMSQGLFRRVILQSVSKYKVDEDPRSTAVKTARYFNCSEALDEASPENLNSTALLECLQAVPLEKMGKAENEIAGSAVGAQVMFPVIDGEFLPEHPAKLLQEGKYQKVDMIAGTTKDEGALFLRLLLGGDISQVKEEYVGDLEYVSWIISQKAPDPEYVTRRIFYRYKEEVPDPVERVMRMYADTHLTMVTRGIAAYHTRDEVFGRRVYAYQLQHRGEHTFSEAFAGPAPQWMKNLVPHMDDVMYLFPKSLRNLTMHFPITRDEDLFVSRLMTDMWANFAKNGDPTPNMALGFKWTPMSESREDYLAITTNPKMKTHDHKDLKFWTNLPTYKNMMLFPERFS